MILIIVDMQHGLFDDPASPRHDARGVIRRINRLISLFRAKKFPVIFIRHNSPPGESLAPGTSGWQILDALDRTPEDTIVDKCSCDAFLNTDLLETISAAGTDQVVITGCATDFCVDTTIRSATAKGLKVTAVSDAHTTADRPHLDAAAIITHHNWMWENLILEENNLRVSDTRTLEKEMP